MSTSVREKSASTLLKVLWIDDQQPLNEALSSAVAEYFRIERVWTPTELSSRLRAALPDIRKTRGTEQVYRFGAFPFDGFLADFNLSRAGESAESRAGENVPIPGPDEKADETPLTGNKVMRPAATPESAEAAGLTSAVLVALNFHAHPSVVVPYTGYPEHMASQRALIRLLAPPSVVISTGSERDRAKDLLPLKLEQFATTYREHLAEWAAEGVIIIPHASIQRLRDTIEARVSGDGIVTWDEADALELDTAYGRRAISCRSLWYHAKPTLQVVTDWLNTFPQPDSTFRMARDLAYQFALLFQDDRTYTRYALSHLLESPDPSQREVDEYCAQIGLDPADVMDKKRREGISISHPRWFCAHLLAVSDDQDVTMLAVLMLVVIRFAIRFNQLGGGYDHPFLRPVFDGTLTKVAIREYLNDSNAEFLLRLLGLKVEIPEDDDEDGPTLVPVDFAPIQLKDMARLIDPLPKQVLTADGKFSELRIGAALRRITLDPPIGACTNLLRLVEALLAEEAVRLSSRDHRALQAFAVELELPRIGWPKWLEEP